jgi:hypothetical protein
LEYARNSLSKLEHDAASILAPVRRVEVQADLSRKRELLEMLMDKLQDLHKVRRLKTELVARATAYNGCADCRGR